MRYRKEKRNLFFSEFSKKILDSSLSLDNVLVYHTTFNSYFVILENNVITFYKRPSKVFDTNLIIKCVSINFNDYRRSLFVFCNMHLSLIKRVFNNLQSIIL